MKRTFLLTATLLSVFLNLISPESSRAETRASEITTYAEQIAGSDVVIMAKCVKTNPKEGNAFGAAEFKIEMIGRDKTMSFEINQIVVCDSLYLRNFKVDQRYLLIGRSSEGDRIDWDRSNRHMTDVCFAYIMETPAFDMPQSERLPFYINCFENSDPLIANDAYGEFANASFEEIVKVSNKFDLAKVRAWVIDPKTVPTRKGLYGKILGLCGNSGDAEVLEQIVFAEQTEFVMGLDGLIMGYLMLAGETGLDKLDQNILQAEDVAIENTYYAMQAVRFMKKHRPDQIPLARLKQSMRLLLDHHRLAEFALVELTMWKDWEIVESVIELYDREEISDFAVRRVIIIYLQTYVDSDEPNAQTDPSRKLTLAKDTLERIQKQDPKNYKRAQQFYRWRKKKAQP